MSIRDDLHFNGKRLQGYINFGLKTTENAGNVLVAKEVIVFLIVALNSHWKIPVGYFLIDGLNAPERAKLVNTCLEMLSDTGAIIKTLTIDGAAPNIAMAKQLGADISNNPTFNHPITNEPIHIFLDAAHMLKLVRNTQWRI
ncbi:THAP domain-containing protein 9 [Aphis craccivora]|uniref:THAP domain-containing protein 9 n=1 Tax=Aphis craccivora TaxID=307492 RepID=A0A6G0Y124_APHCR|nr:THAP domain-containing protein 9 [Aphis craccivora]